MNKKRELLKFAFLDIDYVTANASIFLGNVKKIKEHVLLNETPTS